MKINPNDILPNGTPVQVMTKRGVVIDCKVERAMPSGFISVHTIRFNQRASRGFNRIIWKDISPIQKRVNYSFIETL